MIHDEHLAISRWLVECHHFPPCSSPHRSPRISESLSHLQPAWTQQRREQNGIYLYPAVNLKRK